MKLNEFIETVKDDPNKLFDSGDVNTYIPITRKMAICEVAVRGGEDFPPVMIDRDETGYATSNPADKMLYLAQVYVSEYFNVELDIFGVDEYDSLYLDGVLSKIDRLAERGSNSRHKRSICEIQDDFRNLEKMLNREIANELGRINDPYKRIMQRINDDLSPETMQKSIAELKSVTAQIDRLKARKRQ